MTYKEVTRITAKPCMLTSVNMLECMLFLEEKLVNITKRQKHLNIFHIFYEKISDVATHVLIFIEF